MGDPWDIETALDGGPSGEVQPGDTVWLRGGTYTAPNVAQPSGYTGQFYTTLAGTEADPITFRPYPGERVILDGNYDPAVTGNSSGTVFINAPYQIWRDFELTNSQANRLCSIVIGDGRPAGFQPMMRGSKFINNFVHDTGEGLEAFADASGCEYYGNLIQHNGFIRPTGEYNSGAAIDISPAGGTAVSLTGSATGSSATSLSLTFSFNHTGDSVIVGAGVTHSTGDPTNITATYGGVTMNRINYAGGELNQHPCAIFSLTNGQGAVTGSHDVVISYTVADHRIIGMAQSVVNAAQGSNPSAEGTWAAHATDLPPFASAATSAANRLVMDVVYIYNAYGTGYTVSGDNSLIGYQGSGTGNPEIGMSSAAGAANVSMEWDWVPNLSGHGHGTYVQEGGTVGDAVVTSGDQTVTSASAPWTSQQVGAWILLEGAGPAGADLETTILSRTSASSIEITASPSTSVNPANVRWGRGKIFKHNFFYDEVGYNFQAYGTGGAACLRSSITENIHALGTTYYGGLSGYRLTDSVASGNHYWHGNVNVGYNQSDYTNFKFQRNYCAGNGLGLGSSNPAVWNALEIGGSGEENTIIGSLNNFTTSDFPDNTFYAHPPDPVANLIVVQPNQYETNRANIIVYNWEDLTSVDVDLSSVVAVGTPIRIVNAQDYFNASAVVYEDVYAGGTVSLPMTGLTVAPVVGYDATHYVDPARFAAVPGTTSPGFAAFIVRAQAAEVNWR